MTIYDRINLKFFFLNIPGLHSCSRLTPLHRTKPITPILYLLLTRHLPTHSPSMPPHQAKEHCMMTTVAYMWGITHIYIHMYLCVCTDALVILRKCNIFVFSGEGVRRRWGHSGPGRRAVTERQRAPSGLRLRRELHPRVAGAASGSAAQSGTQPQPRLLPTTTGLSRPKLSAQVSVTERSKRTGNNMEYCFTGASHQLAEWPSVGLNLG